MARLLLFALALSAATADAQIVRIKQSGFVTCGAVVKSEPGCTWVLTCRHSRNPRDPWKAGKLSGTRTILCESADLALLVTADVWRGPVLSIAAVEPKPALPIRFVNNRLLPCPLPFGCPMYELPALVRPGDSGMPLVIGGEVYGVLFDQTEGCGLFTRRADVERFVKGVRLP